MTRWLRRQIFCRYGTHRWTQKHAPGFYVCEDCDDPGFLVPFA